jgi:hypothetical protein
MHYIFAMILAGGLSAVETPIDPPTDRSSPAIVAAVPGPQSALTALGPWMRQRFAARPLETLEELQLALSEGVRTCDSSANVPRTVTTTWNGVFPVPVPRFVLDMLVQSGRVLPSEDRPYSVKLPELTTRRTTRTAETPLETYAITGSFAGRSETRQYDISIMILAIPGDGTTIWCERAVRR